MSVLIFIVDASPNIDQSLQIEYFEIKNFKISLSLLAQKKNKIKKYACRKEKDRQKKKKKKIKRRMSLL